MPYSLDEIVTSIKNEMPKPQDCKATDILFAWKLSQILSREVISISLVGSVHYYPFSRGLIWI
jgi:hypothetical protein